MKKRSILFAIALLLSGGLFLLSKGANINPLYKIGDPIDSLNTVKVYYNGAVSHVLERNTTADGYNLGQKYQCVEFVKRYYYEYYNHKMPDSYGHAKSFFDQTLKDGFLNKSRGLTQYSNPSKVKPKAGDILVMGETSFNSYGHVAIVAVVGESEIEIIQQNLGPFSSSRARFRLLEREAVWLIENKNVLGWLRKE